MWAFPIGTPHLAQDLVIGTCYNIDPVDVIFMSLCDMSEKHLRMIPAN